jgi:hypothetical protein
MPAPSTFPAALLSRNPARWLTIFGPGAVIASLTIGSGELIFSSRAGALFGYRLLWFFTLVLLFKWALVFGAARHMVLTGAHPFERWTALPGPRGWLPLVFLVLALICFPIWVCFHSGTIGTLLSWLAGTNQALRGGAHWIWGLAVLTAVLALVFAGGYAALERIQLVIVLLMLGSVLVALVLVQPDWWALLRSFVVPQPLAYPDWALARTEFDARPVWVEVITYVGVIGGSGYDYLAYVSYLRDKRWGRAGAAEAPADAVATVDRRWVRAPLIDCTLSFAAVLGFSAVFVACGATILGPQHLAPAGANLLDLQAAFVERVHPWLKPLYFVGAFLTMLGTLYGTIEVAPAVLREVVHGFNGARAEQHAARLRRWSVLWVGVGGGVMLVGSLLYHLNSGRSNPPGLIALLTPANLFTGVLSCGLICWLTLWTDWRFLAADQRARWPLAVLGAVAGTVFLALGIKGYWDHSGWTAFGILAGTLGVGWLGAWFVARRRER